MMSSSVDLNSSFSPTPTPDNTDEKRVRRLSLDDKTSLAESAKKVPFPSYQEWLDKIKVDGENSEECQEKIPEDFKQDVDFAVQTFTLKNTFEKLDKTVCFNFSCGQLSLRLQGSYELEKGIYELGLKHVKPLKQIFWVNFKENKGFLFAQKIISRVGKITAEEVHEIKALVDHTGFSEYGRDNIIAGDSGIYFVDTGDGFAGSRFSYINFWGSSVLKHTPGFDEEALKLMGVGSQNF